MKISNKMKNRILLIGIIVAAMIALSSCHRKTCPAYLSSVKVVRPKPAKLSDQCAKWLKYRKTPVDRTWMTQ